MKRLVFAVLLKKLLVQFPRFLSAFFVAHWFLLLFSALLKGDHVVPRNAPIPGIWHHFLSHMLTKRPRHAPVNALLYAHTQSLFLLYESASGYALFERVESEQIGAQTPEVIATQVSFRALRILPFARLVVPVHLFLKGFLHWHCPFAL